MSLMGSGVIAIWNDITDEGRENFYEWHDREHIPERVGIPGFLRGRRYVALSGAPEYFTLYEVTERAVLTSPNYLARLNSPTDWTSRSVQHFRNTSRSLCDTAFSRGAASGGFIGTIRFDCDPKHDADLFAALSHTVLPAVIEARALRAAHVCRADESASKVQTSEQRGRSANEVPRWVILVEGATPAAIDDAFSQQLSPRMFAELGAPDVLQGVYCLQYDLLSAG